MIDREAPRFLRLTRALALGALAAPALQCAPAAAQRAPELTRVGSSSGAQPTGSREIEPPRTGSSCGQAGARHDRIDGRALVVCGCARSPAPEGAPSALAWSCTSFDRTADGLDRRACAAPGEQRGDEPASPNRTCVCVADGTRAEYACYQTIMMAPGPLPPPEWPREILS